VDTETDNAHCGACNLVCPDGFLCTSGECVLNCGGTTPDACNGGCVDATSNTHACGRPGASPNPCMDCETATGLGSECVQGTCECNVGSNPDTCDGLCVDLNANPSHCGECGSDCEAGEVCSGGTCALTCPSPLVACNGGCTNTSYDPDNCGGVRGLRRRGLRCSDQRSWVVQPRHLRIRLQRRLLQLRR
jgi:hypothetical protein